jgi:hypothetical protein
VAHELIGLYQEHERLRQGEGIGDIEPCPTRGNVPHRAIEAAATAKGESAVFEHPLSGRCSLLYHGSKSQTAPFALIFWDSKRKLPAIESNMPRIWIQIQVSLAMIHSRPSLQVFSQHREGA